MKKTLFILSACIVITFTSCAQSKQTDNKLNRVKRNEKVNEYTIRHHSSFPIEIGINDIPVVRQTEYLGTELSTFINWAIPKSGTQILTYTIDLKSYYSRADKLKELKSTYGYEEKPEVEIVWFAACCGNSILSAPENAMRYDLYFDKLKQSDVDRGFYTDTITFETKVGYNLSDWERGTVLSEMNQPLLKEKLYRIYKSMIRNLKKENKTSLDIDWENALYENAVSRNWEKDWAIEEQTGIYSIVPELLPLDSCELKIYGNGRLASLISKEQLIPVSALTSTLYNKVFQRNFIQYHNLYFYMPEGSDEFKLIRYDFYSIQ